LHARKQTGVHGVPLVVLVRGSAVGTKAARRARAPDKSRGGVHADVELLDARSAPSAAAPPRRRCRFFASASVTRWPPPSAPAPACR